MGQGRQRHTSPLNGATEPLVVRTIQLAIPLHRFIQEHRADHPQGLPHWKEYRTKGRWGGEEFTMEARERMPETGPVQYLAERSGVNERAVERIIRCETEVTSLSIADDLLTAAGLKYKMDNGEVQVIPNPMLSQETYIKRMQERGCY